MILDRIYLVIVYHVQILTSPGGLTEIQNGDTPHIQSAASANTQIQTTAKPDRNITETKRKTWLPWQPSLKSSGALSHQTAELNSAKPTNCAQEMKVGQR